jgi:hypothetical protein
MAFDNLSGPLRVGPIREGASKNTGLVLLAQQYDSGTITGVSGTKIRATPFIIPKGAYIVDIVVDCLQVTNAVTTVGVSVGTTLDGFDLFTGATLYNTGFFTDVSGVTTNYYSSVNTSFSNINTSVAAKRTAALNGDAKLYTLLSINNATATQGRINITVLYVQRGEDGSQNPVNT